MELRGQGPEYKKWANSEDRFQLIVSTGTSLGDLIISMTKAEDTYVSNGIQTYNLSFHVAEGISSKTAQVPVIEYCLTEKRKSIFICYCTNSFSFGSHCEKCKT